MDYSCRIIFEREAFVFEMLKARLFARVKPFVKDLIEDELVLPSPKFFASKFFCFSLVKSFLIVADFDAASWKVAGHLLPLLSLVCMRIRGDA